MSNTVTDARVLRSYVARWLALRSEHAAESWGVKTVPREKQAQVFERLAADALQSEPLLRLLVREQPRKWNDFSAVVVSWLHACAELASQRSEGLPESLLARERQPGLFRQLAWDAMHSGLLGRLFNGEEPLPFEEWKVRRIERGTSFVGPTRSREPLRDQ
jgi:hypothetical protein